MNKESLKKIKTLVFSALIDLPCFIAIYGHGVTLAGLHADQHDSIENVVEAKNLLVENVAINTYNVR